VAGGASVIILAFQPAEKWRSKRTYPSLQKKQNKTKTLRLLGNLP
jgi:hypothetical protein